jgi:hypothetical protein
MEDASRPHRGAFVGLAAVIAVTLLWLVCQALVAIIG